jgi:hypothetical protein
VTPAHGATRNAGKEKDIRRPLAISIATQQ